MAYNPTTTLAALRANNTSAYSGYTISNLDSPSLIPSNYTIASNFDPSNPLWDKSKNLSPLNTSKESMAALLGSAIQIAPMALWIPWWGKNAYDHINIGYNQFTSNAQAVRQVADLQARGLGVCIDYYGPNYDPAQTYFRDACIDAGLPMTLMLDSNMSPAVTTTSGLNALMDTLNTEYFSKANYVKVGGRPVMVDFGFETFGSITWSSVRTHIAALSQGNPIWLGRFSGPAVTDRGGFLDGWHGWPSPSDGVTNYLGYFYARQAAQPTKVYWGPVFKGFNDALASWGTGRVIAQNNGQAYLDTINGVKNHGPMQSAMVATWNDYEEGTEIETGVGAGANFAVSLNTSGNNIQWTATGTTGLIAKYRVWFSRDNLGAMQVGGDLPPGTTTFDPASSGFADGQQYSIYVQAIGYPSVVNVLSLMSAQWTATQSPTQPPPIVPPGPAPDDFAAHRAQNHAFAFGQHLVGDWNSGAIYKLVSDGDDFGGAIHYERQAPPIAIESEYMYHSSLVFDVESIGGTPTLVVDWSDDGTTTYSNPRTLSATNAGHQKHNRVTTAMLGRSRSRIYRIRTMSPLRIIDGYLTLTPGGGVEERLPKKMARQA